MEIIVVIAAFIFLGAAVGIVELYKEYIVKFSTGSRKKMASLQRTIPIFLIILIVSLLASRIIYKNLDAIFKTGEPPPGYHYVGAQPPAPGLVPLLPYIWQFINLYFMGWATGYSVQERRLAFSLATVWPLPVMTLNVIVIPHFSIMGLSSIGAILVLLFILAVAVLICRSGLRAGRLRFIENWLKTHTLEDWNSYKNRKLFHIKDLFQALSYESDGNVRRYAASQLGMSGETKAAIRLLPSLRDKNKGVREEAVIALGRLGNIRAIPGLIQALADGEQEVREAAIHSLVQFGESAAEPLTAAMHVKNKRIKIGAESALKELRNTQSTRLN